MTGDPEIKALTQVSSALEDLSSDAERVRVLDWAWKRYAPDGARVARREVDMAEDDDHHGDGNASEYEEFYELYEAAAPDSGLDRLLVACYWFQVVQGDSSLDGRSLNQELKHMGQGSSNITRDMNSLMGRSPALVMKIRKDGSTRQARNTYKLTRAGIQAVEELLAGA